jgi:tetratricopeptide (TPR) repeat protein
MGDARGAVEQFEEVVRLSPGYAQAHYSLGVFMEASGRNEQAIERFSAAVRQEPTYIEARLRLARLLRRVGRVQESMVHEAQVMRIDPRVAEAPFGYATALVALGRYRDARDRLSDAIETYPARPAFAHALARLLATAPDADVRDGPRAMTLVQELLRQQPTAELRETMAMTLAELGRYEDAATWQRETIASVKAGERGERAALMAARLRSYERRTPWRNPALDELGLLQGTADTF